MANRSVASPKVIAQLLANVRNTMDDGVIVSGAVNGNTNDTLTNGVSANQANRAWQWLTKDLGSGGAITLDLYDFAGFDAGAGAGNDIVGQAMALEEIVAIKIKNNNDVALAGQLEVIPDPTNGWTPMGSHTVATGGALRGGGVILMYQPAESGFDVVDGSSHRIRLRAFGGAVNYSIWILGRHDDNESSSSESSSVSSSSSSLSSESSSLSSKSSSVSSSSISNSTSSLVSWSSASSASSASSISSVSSSSVSSQSSSFSSQSSSSSVSSRSESSSSSQSSSSSNLEPLWCGPVRSGVSPSIVLGEYTRAGSLNNRNYYSNGLFYLWWDSGGTNRWTLSDAPNNKTGDCWQQSGGGAGQLPDAYDYGPISGSATGTIWVALDKVGDSSSRSSSLSTSSSVSSSSWSSQT